MRRAEPRGSLRGPVGWLSRHAGGAIAARAIVRVLSAFLIVRYLLPRADLSYVLPQDSPAVRDLRRLSLRLAARDTALVIGTAPTSQARADSGDRIAASARARPRDLVLAMFIVVSTLVRSRRLGPGSRSRKRRATWLVTYALGALVACEQPRIEVASTADDRQSKLQSAIADFVAAQRTPAAFATLAQRVRELRPMTRELAREAERRVVVLAVWPMQSVEALPLERQVQALALTVWPTLVGAPLTATADDLQLLPATDESVAGYVSRLCAQLPDAGCAAASPGDHAKSLAVFVARRGKERTREAVDACAECKQDRGWHEALRAWEHIERQAVHRIQ